MPNTEGLTGPGKLPDRRTVALAQRDIRPDEALEPTRAAELFVEFCNHLSEKGKEAQEAEMSHRDGFIFVNDSDPTMVLHKIINLYYAGTSTARTDLLVNGFETHGAGVPVRLVGYDTDGEYEERQDSAKYEEKTPFSEWPKKLGINIRRGNAGVFSEGGARNYEIESLSRSINLALARMGLGTVTAEEIVDIQTQVDEFNALFGAPFFQGSERLENLFQRFTDLSPDFIKDPPFDYERDPKIIFSYLASLGGNDSSMFRVLSQHYDDLLAEFEGRFVLLTRSQNGIISLMNTSFLTYPEALMHAIENFPSDQILIQRILKNSLNPNNRVT